MELDGIRGDLKKSERVEENWRELERFRRKEETYREREGLERIGVDWRQNKIGERNEPEGIGWMSLKEIRMDWERL